MSPTRGLFIAGTDTGVGKTRVAVHLVRAYAARGLKVAVMKPVAAGASRTADGLRNCDALALCAATSLALPYDKVNPYCFAAETSPHLAARAAGAIIEPGRVFEAYAALTAIADFVVVEGAGGWLAPIGETQTMADIAVALGLPVVLVVGLRLGCLNHAQLTAGAVATAGLPLQGWYANEIEPHFPPLEDYLESLASRLPAPRLGFMRYGES